MLYRIIIITFLLIGCNSQDKPQNESVANVKLYTCSMHPNVRTSKQSDICPVCHMSLVPVINKSLHPNSLHISEREAFLANIKTQVLEKKIGITEDLLTGILKTDETKETTISIRISGRIEKLYVKEEGIFISKGTALFDLYSEELNNLKEEYQNLVLNTSVNAAYTSMRERTTMLNNARNKLVLLGLSEEQIKALEKGDPPAIVTTFYSSSSGYLTKLAILEGDYVKEGFTIMRLADMRSLWAEAQTFHTQMPLITDRTYATIQTADHENSKEIACNGILLIPEIKEGMEIHLIRVSLQVTEPDLKPGALVYIRLKKPIIASLMIPNDAVIHTKKGDIVWIKVKSTGEYQQRQVMLGQEIGNESVVLSGLSEGDDLVISGSYLIQSAFLLQGNADV